MSENFPSHARTLIEVSSLFFKSDPEIVDAWLLEHDKETVPQLARALRNTTLRIEDQNCICYVMGFLGGSVLFAGDKFGDIGH